ncbi:MAG: acetyl-CoA carboxylase biotin carboxyl carrier protein subunit [Ruminococcaceae bacterium]|nr:acetyl-CoA carboxylase biotin carboxyl carrier protein subunit [Oscillospiraceae bacterium]
MAKYVVTLNGKNYEVEVEKNTAKITNTTAAAAPAAAPAPKAAPAPAPVAAPAPAPAPAPVAAAPAGGANVTAPMPGTVLNVVAPVGTAVKAGDVILILEAMKMENDIVAPCDGTVASVSAKGTSVNTDDVLATLS